MKGLANLSNRCMYSVVKVMKRFLAPESRDNLIPGDQSPASLHKQKQQFHGQPFHTNWPSAPT